jgi:hypothetical protein
VLYNKSELNGILESHKKWLNGDSSGVKADLNGAALSGADLSGADLSGVTLRGACLRGANLSRGKLCAADLRGADFRWACLCGAELDKVNLIEADLSGAELHGASLRNADLRGADFRGANLQKAYMRGTNLYETDVSVVSAGPIGSRHGITICSLDVDEVQCGCFRGSLEYFAARVEQMHADNPRWLAEYRAAIGYFKAVKAARIPD